MAAPNFAVVIGVIIQRCATVIGVTIQRLRSRPMTRSITIVGAGLGGLVLARVLHVHGLSVTVYEVEASAGERALEAAGLIKHFQGLVLPGRQSYRVLDRAGTVLLDLPDDGAGERPEAP